MIIGATPEIRSILNSTCLSGGTPRKYSGKTSKTRKPLANLKLNSSSLPECQSCKQDIPNNHVVDISSPHRRAEIRTNSGAIIVDNQLPPPLEVRTTTNCRSQLIISPNRLNQSMFIFTQTVEFCVL